MALSLDRRTLFKLYYLCLIVVVVAGLAVHFMEAGHEAPEAVEGPLAHGEEALHEEAQEEASHEAEHEAEEEGFWWLDIPLFAAGFAFLGGVVLLALAKLGIFPLIKREEDYYDQHSIKKREEQSKGGGH
jgi:hypothetical protein